MEAVEYERMNRLEDRMWWYRAAHANMLGAFRRINPTGGAVLDAGCGTGGLLARLRLEAPDRALVGLDFEARACAFARAKCGAAVVVGSVNALPFAAGSLAAIFSIDVLCHRSVDQARALAEAYRCLAPGGVMIVNLPAFHWLKSVHDAQVHTARRYTRAEVGALLAEVGFAQVRTRYWNSLLFPLMLLRRKVLKPRAAESDVMDYPAPVEFLFRATMALERGLQAWGLSFPFGGSVLAVAVKHG